MSKYDILSSCPYKRLLLNMIERDDGILYSGLKLYPNLSFDNNGDIWKKNSNNF